MGFVICFLPVTKIGVNWCQNSSDSWVPNTQCLMSNTSCYDTIPMPPCAIPRAAPCGPNALVSFGALYRTAGTMGMLLGRLS